jgi:uncharacterized membrane protein YfcA
VVDVGDYPRMIDPLYSLSGFGVGLLVGMTGVGGGSLMTPLLILLFGIHPATAVGTDLIYAAATKTGGSLVHGIEHNIEWQAVRRLAAGSVPATMVTLAGLYFMNLESQAASSLITLVLCGALLVTAGTTAPHASGGKGKSIRRDAATRSAPDKNSSRWAGRRPRGRRSRCACQHCAIQ